MLRHLAERPERATGSVRDLPPSYLPPPRRFDDIADRLAFVMTVAGGLAVVIVHWCLRPLRRARSRPAYGRSSNSTRRSAKT